MTALPLRVDEDPIQRGYDLAQAGEALQALGAGHTQGKLAIRTDSAR